MTIASDAAIGAGRASEIVLKQLGEVTVDASRLEHLACAVAHSVKLPDPDRDTVARLQDAELRPPPWSTATPKDVTAWATSVARLLDIRDRMFIASGSARFSGSRGDTIATTATDGTLFPVDEDYLSRLLHRLERQFAAGSDLLSRLDYHDEHGQRWPLVQLYATTGAESATPTIANLPAEWRSWLSA